MTRALVLSITALWAATSFAQNFSATRFAAPRTVGSSRASEAKRNAEAARMLFHALERTRRMNVEAIVLRRAPGSDECGMVKMKLEQAENGAFRTTILGPLSHQGVTTVDNGKEWRVYWPDENRLLVQPSMLNQPGPASRADLAERNYRFTVLDGPSVAGRPTTIIVATPRAEGAPVRRFYLDENTGFLLRVEMGEGPRRQVLVDTRVVIYGEKPDLAEFDLDIAEKVRTLRRNHPTAVPNAEEAKRRLGFKPGVPLELPLGFSVTSLDLTGSDRSPYAAIRVTDGLTSFTIYQARGAAAKMLKEFPGKEVKGVRIAFVGDAPQELMSGFLEIFLRELAKGLPTLFETPEQRPPLNGEPAIIDMELAGR